LGDYRKVAKGSRMVTFDDILVVTSQTLQEAQLPQRNSASAAHMEGLGPPAPSPSPPLATPMRIYGRIRKPQRTYVKRAVLKAHFKMNRAFKVIQGHPYWCRQESRTVCCRNVQLIPTLFLKLRKIWQRENGQEAQLPQRDSA